MFVNGISGAHNIIATARNNNWRCARDRQENLTTYYYNTKSLENLNVIGLFEFNIRYYDSDFQRKSIGYFWEWRIMKYIEFKLYRWNVVRKCTIIILLLVYWFRYKIDRLEHFGNLVIKRMTPPIYIGEPGGKVGTSTFRGRTELT